MISFRPTNIRFRIAAEDDRGNCSKGGDVFIAIAAVALNAGDVVFFSANETVSKSITATDHDQVAGVVVGGTRSYMNALTFDTTAALFNVAQANEQVLVQRAGIAVVTAGAAITIGVPVKPDTGTAGRVIPAVLGTGADQGKVVGRAIETAAGAGDRIRILISNS